MDEPEKIVDVYANFVFHGVPTHEEVQVESPDPDLVNRPAGAYATIFTEHVTVYHMSRGRVCPISAWLPITAYFYGEQFGLAGLERVLDPDELKVVSQWMESSGDEELVRTEHGILIAPRRDLADFFEGWGDADDCPYAIVPSVMPVLEGFPDNASDWEIRP